MTLLSFSLHLLDDVLLTVMSFLTWQVLGGRHIEWLCEKSLIGVACFGKRELVAEFVLLL